MEKMDVPKKGVSARFGVILMIVITIATASTVYVYVGGMIGGTKNQPYLELSVIPNGYPELFNDWDITVWKVIDPVNKTHISGDNVSITAEIFNRNTKNKISEYQLTTNENGRCSFTYNNETQSYKFRATADGFRSDQFEPIVKYVSPDRISDITSLFNFASLLAIIGIISFLYLIKSHIDKRKKNYELRLNLFKILTFVSILLFSIVFIGMILLAILNNTITTFGYPDSDILLGLTIIYWISMILIATIILAFITWFISPKLPERKNNYLE